MTIEEAAGRVLMIGLAGPEPSATAIDRLKALQPGGAILFRRNIDSPAAAATLLQRLREALPPPTLFAVDQEGGPVSRLEPWIGPTPAAATVAAAGGGAAFRLGRATAAALRSLGFNLDFAPVVDLCAPDRPNGIGARSFGVDPDRAADLAGAFLDGLQGHGVAGCLKHFPGLGDTSVDSHERLPLVERDVRQLEQSDLVPYVRLAPRAASVMVGHGHYPALDPQPDLPATLSAAIVDGWLRRRIGYRGLIVSDDLEMGAVADLDAGGAAAVAAVGAGCDLLLYCSDLERAEVARRALVAAAASASFAERLEEAASRVVQTAARWPASTVDLDAWESARRDLWDAAHFA